MSERFSRRPRVGDARGAGSGDQHALFSDHYLDIPFSLEHVMFLTTANSYDTIPAPLLDRMEIIDLSSYTELEKISIAKNHLIPKQREGARFQH